MKELLRKNGFTVVELVVVIVVIAILATVSVVAYRGAQERSRDTVRRNDISSINKAIITYIGVTRHAPDFNGACAATSTGGGVSACFANDADGSGGYTWANLSSILVPQYMDSLPKDPCGAKCYNKQVANYQSDGYFVYKYNAPGYFPSFYGLKDTNYTIVAQNLESKAASFGFGIGSY